MSFDMKGTVDIHVHAGPSVAKRRVDAGDMLMDGISYGYQAFVSKDHYFPTVMGTDMVTKFLGAGKCSAYGCIVLNNSVGGINVYAVDAACAMGAKIVFMPTVSALNHIESHKKGFVGAGKMKIPEKPIYYLDENGELKPEVLEVLEYLAEYHPEVTLGTGHGSVAEINKLIDKAVAEGCEVVGSCIVAGKHVWKEEDGKILYNTNITGEIFDEELSPWAEIEADADGNITLMGVLRLTRT